MIVYNRLMRSEVIELHTETFLMLTGATDLAGKPRPGLERDVAFFRFACALTPDQGGIRVDADRVDELLAARERARGEITPGT